jgi:tetratricopeptide (TPR) repeat protein
MAGRGGEAEQALGRAVELEPNHTEAAMALGFLLLDRGKYEKADALYQRLAERSALTAGESTLVVGRLGRAEALVGAGKLDEAQAQLDAIADKAESLGTYRVAAGRLALARGDAEDAVATLRPVASEDEANPGVIALFGDALYEAGKVREASAQYERALEKDSTYPEALLGEMRVHVRAEKPKDALAFVEDMEEQLERRIRPPRLLAELRTLEGRAHLQRGRRNEDEARAALRAATEIDAVPGEAWFFLGEALSGENAPEARAAYERYLELEPEGPYAKRAQRAID